ncbi:hypothetical protein HXX76_011340 [Chlamydomonas incerta]|uniref:Uncharacterized protein n=1 Tax=Chlamydomonas incerta TaxID=51695 RepID=A0A835SK72_CHLIN|nr:hypothetical protein HXX76_011340 [Chlamydomonas incerta]|eukprot:KAG2428633.1 hypothetical protein HXX76_011340 [Chlamydomonas incerta]
MDDECGPASGAAFDSQGGEAADSAEDVCDTPDTDAKAATAAAAASTAEELNTSCLPGGIAKLMNADSDVPAPAAAGAALAGVGAAGSYGHVATRAMQQRFSVNGIAAGAPSSSAGASPVPTAVGISELPPRWMQPDPVHSAHTTGDASTPLATGPAAAAAVSAMGQWDSSYSLNTTNQQQPCNSGSYAYEAACGVPAFPADARAQRGPAAGLKRGFDESCYGAEDACGPVLQRMRGGTRNPLAAADLVGAASSSNSGSAASAAWLRRADRELNDLMRDMGMLVEDDGCGMAGGAGAASAMRGLAPLRLPDPRPQRDLSSLLLLRGQALAGHGPVVEQMRLQQPQQMQLAPDWQLLQHVHVQPQQTMRCAPDGWQLQRGASVGGYEIEAIDSVPLEALL